MDNIFETLINDGSPKLAIRYAKRIIKNGEGKNQRRLHLERRCMSCGETGEVSAGGSTSFGSRRGIIIGKYKSLLFGFF